MGATNTFTFPGCPVVKIPGQGAKMPHAMQCSQKKKKIIAVLEHQSPNFLEPGTSFVEDNFSTESGSVSG